MRAPDLVNFGASVNLTPPNLASPCARGYEISVRVRPSRPGEVERYAVSARRAARAEIGQVMSHAARALCLAGGLRGLAERILALGMAGAPAGHFSRVIHFS